MERNLGFVMTIHRNLDLRIRWIFFVWWGPVKSDLLTETNGSNQNSEHEK